MRPALALLAVSILLGASGSAHAEHRGPPSARTVPVVQLYTMGVGEALFERFGHAAMCLHAPRQPEHDLCFNYGTTDFQTPVPLTWNFLRGRAQFWVSRATPGAMLQVYRSFDRTVYRQDLPLDDDQAIALAGRLLADSRPTKRPYIYHHFHDNCSTRLRDLIDEASAGALRRGADEPVEESYRELARRGFANETWLLLVTDLTIGRAVDRRPTRWEAMFLPAVLRAEVQRRLGAEPVLVYQRRGPEIPQEPGGGGRVLFLLTAVLLGLVLLIARLTGRFPRASVVLVALVLGGAGMILWSIAVISALAELRLNEALLIFLPTDVVLPFLKHHWRQRYARLRVVELVLLSSLLALGFLRQPLFAPLLVPLLPLLVLAFSRNRAPSSCSDAADA